MIIGFIKFLIETSINVFQTENIHKLEKKKENKKQISMQQIRK